MLANALSKYWWVTLLRGIVAILFSIAAFVQPSIALITLVFLFAIYATIEGVLTIGSAISARKSDEHWWVLLLEGALAVAFGIMTFARPALSTFGLLVYVASWAIVMGALRIATAIRLRKEIQSEWWMGLSGAMSVVAGVVMMAQPAAGALAYVWFIGAWAFVVGVALVVLSLELRHHNRRIGEREPVSRRAH